MTMIFLFLETDAPTPRTNCFNLCMYKDLVPLSLFLALGGDRGEEEEEEEGARKGYCTNASMQPAPLGGPERKGNLPISVKQVTLAIFGQHVPVHCEPPGEIGC